MASVRTILRLREAQMSDSGGDYFGGFGEDAG